MSGAEPQKAALVLCGAFSPPTYAHMRLCERARDLVNASARFRVVEGLLAPSTSDSVPSRHRLRMVEAACRSSSWLKNMPSTEDALTQKWAAPLRDMIIYCQEVVGGSDSFLHPSTPSTSGALSSIAKEMRKKYNADVTVLLVCGSDALASFGENKELEEIVKHYGMVVLKRKGVDPMDVLYRSNLLRKYQRHIFICRDETFPNDLSSSRIRKAIERGESAKYCTDDAVLEYIDEHNLYKSNSPRESPAPTASTTSTLEGPVKSEERAGPSSSISSSASRRNSDTPSEQGDPPSPTNTITNSAAIPSRPFWRDNKKSPDKPKDLSLNTVPSTSTSSGPSLVHIPRALDSPHYDNVSAEEVLAASTSWANYNRQHGWAPNKVSDLPDLLEESTPRRKKGWFFGRSRSVKDQKGSSDEEGLVGICETDRREQGATSPEILWRKISQLHARGGKDLPPSPKKACSRHPGRVFEERRRSIKTQPLQLALTRSTEDLRNIAVSQLENCGMSQSMFSSPPDGVTLTFRRYRLTNTPETTV